ncbi:hypothetical protein GALMADRAFT_148722 [Galerina marginata CBS 339.88]|uniref:Uncharacterized protein n=1 Tax=Galerina marginata (strain CBS 339.88) TaxID=685588 RepID=A0A067SCC9_GALM3|nr:hypothetical protein GALMADRAFT_148722 [Galerina marginata CBS 339.88]
MNCIAPTDIKLPFTPPRPEYLPDIYVAANHPKHYGAGLAYFFVLDGSPSGLQKIRELEETVLRVPNGSEKEAIDQGFLKLVDGDAIFARLASSPSSGEKDVAVMWVNGPNIFSLKLREDAINARGVALGPRALRTRSEPTDAGGGNLVGGTAWERTNPTKVRGGRCYAFGMSFQTQRTVSSPCADGKVKSNSKANLDMRSGLIGVASAMAMRAIRTGPMEIMEHIDINANILNVPSIGSNGNTAFAAAQLNLAPTRRVNSDETLGESMGTAGEEHIDYDDSHGHYTHMSALSDLPDTFDPGRFFVLYPGVFVTLSTFSSVCFSGLRRHGSSPPIAPVAATDEELSWATRVTLISYPPSGMNGINQRRPLGALAVGGPLYAIPEMITPEPFTERLSCYPSTFAEDGGVIMPRMSLVTFLARSFLTLVLCILAQLDPVIGARVDSDTFLRSFSFNNAHGNRQRVGPWKLGPGWRSPDASNEPSHNDLLVDYDLVSQRTLIAEKYNQWLDFCNFYGAHIPYAVCSGSVPALEEDGLDYGVNEGSPSSNLVAGGLTDSISSNLPINPIPIPPAPGNLPGSPEKTNVPERPAPPAPKKNKGKNKADNQSGPSKPGKKPRKSVQTDSEDDSERESSSDVLYLAWSGDGYKKLVTAFGPTNTPASSSTCATRATRTTRSQKVVEIADGTKDYPMVLDDSDCEMVEDIIDISASQSVMEVLSDAAQIPLSESMSMLQAHHNAITSHPLDASSVPLLRSSWVGLNALQSSERANALLLRKQRSCIMFTAYISWLWLNVFIPKHVHGLLQDINTASVAWLSTLVSGVGSTLRSGSTEETFIAHSYGLDMPGTQCVIRIGMTNSLDSFDNRVANLVVDILGKWLAYPTSEHIKYQAYFIHVLLRDIGHDVLMLDAVWKTYQRVNRRSFVGSGPLTFDNAASTIQLTHPIFDINSVERKNISDIASVVNDFIDGRLVIQATTTKNALPVDVIPPQIASAMDRRLSLLKKFIADCYSVTFKGIHIPNDRLYCALRTKPDYFVPFREHAPTRIHMRGQNGPFSRTRARTTEGVFSALVGRSITFGTEFSRTGRTFFMSAEDFYAACDEMGPQDDKFFCDPSAYGQYNHKKTTSLADIYWEQLQIFEWPGISNHGMVPFMVCFRFFKPSTGPARFPELGNLAAYLLTADYVYAGIVCPPSKEEMGHIIQLINLGAVRGLELIGYIPTRRTTGRGARGKAVVKACVDGFDRSFGDIAGCISKAEHNEVGVDYIMAENTLSVPKFPSVLSFKDYYLVPFKGIWISND